MSYHRQVRWNGYRHPRKMRPYGFSHILVDYKAFDGGWYVRNYPGRLSQQAARRYPKKVARQQAKQAIRRLSCI